MFYTHMIVYKKESGELTYRAVTRQPLFEKGYKNSYGWTVEEILRISNGCCYPVEKYNEKLKRKLNLYEFLFSYRKINVKKICEWFVLFLLLKNYL